MRARALAMTLALCATTLTAAAHAGEADAQGAAPAAQGATPLSLRPAKAIELAPEPQHGPMAWKVAFVLALVGGAAIALRRRAAAQRPARPSELTIVRRAALGLRSELVVVNVEGQRLLIGVTPHSIQSLAILDADDTQAHAATLAAPGASTLGDRFAAMLDSAGRGAAPEPAAPARVAAKAEPWRAARAARPPTPADDVAEQARGLVALRRAG